MMNNNNNNNNVEVVASLSQCSSGCESGWTLYLDHSTSHNFSTSSHKNKSFSQEQQYYCTKNGFYDNKQENEDEEEEDLSMVSDASSGPPHFDHDIDEEEEDNLCYVDNGGRLLKKRSINLEYEYEMQCCNVAGDFALDDTASSHVLLASKKIGGIHVQNNQGDASFERLMDYSTQGYSTTHFQGSSSNFQEHLAVSNLNSRKRFHHQHNQ